MILNLYNTDDSENVINKTLVNVVSFNVNLKRDFNLFSPQIVLNSELDLNGYNYAVLVDLGRSYFINEVDLIGNNLFNLSMSCDVLETFKDDILNSDCVYKRGIKTGDYVNAPLETTVNKKLEVYQSNVTLDDGVTMIMSTVGSV